MTPARYLHHSIIIQTYNLLQMRSSMRIYLALLQACGVDFEVKAYLANAALNPDEVIEKKYGYLRLKYAFDLIFCGIQKPCPDCVCFYFLFFSSVRDTCRLMIRKIQFAPANNKAGPTTEISKQFMMNDKPVQLEASLEKEVRAPAL